RTGSWPIGRLTSQRCVPTTAATGNGCGRGRCRSSSATAPSTSWTTPGRWRTRTSRVKPTRDQRGTGSRELFQAAQTLWTSAERTTPPALRHQRLPAGRTLDLRPLRKQVHRDRGAGKSVPPRSSCQLKRFAFCSTVVPPEGLDLRHAVLESVGAEVRSTLKLSD